MAYYAIYLGTGQTIRSMCIQSTTIKKYVLAVAQLYFDITGTDPRYMGTVPQSHNTPIHQSIKNVFNELERWEKVKDLKEPVTIPMVYCLKQLQAQLQTPTTSKLNAILD